MAEKLIEAGGYKKDNEILSSQISELIEHNKKLAERIEELEKKEEPRKVVKTKTVKKTKKA